MPTGVSWLYLTVWCAGPRCLHRPQPCCDLGKETTTSKCGQGMLQAASLGGKRSTCWAIVERALGVSCIAGDARRLVCEPAGCQPQRLTSLDLPQSAVDIA